MAGSSPPVGIQSISFADQENDQAVSIRDPADGRFLGAIPEWQTGHSPDPAAYPCGARPRIRVVFNRAGGLTDGAWTIQARGTGGPGVAARQVQLRFDAAGHSEPCELELGAALPASVGSLTVHWDWTATGGDGPIPLGATDHLIYLVWKLPVESRLWDKSKHPASAPRPASVAGRWVFEPLLRWTCAWAAGRADEKAICDAIIANVHQTGLQYAVPAWSVHAMLRKGGGYCGGWYRMFQALAGVQGVRVERRSFWVVWPADAEHDVRWCAIVVKAPGINRTEPVDDPSLFHDVAAQPVHLAPVQDVTERRYRFWGAPGVASDGHCVNFLRYDGTWYLYDACFFDRCIPLEGFQLPEVNGKTPVPTRALGNFKEAYLQVAVDHMLGTIEVAGRLYRAVPPNGKGNPPEENGVTVQTSIIPPEAPKLAFYWMS